METPSPAEPRRLLRVPLPVETVIDGGVARFLGYVSNVSNGGLFVQCSVPRATGTRLRLRVHLPGAPDGALACNGRVVWTRGYAGTNAPTPGMGIELTEPPAPVVEFLGRFLKDATKE